MKTLLLKNLVTVMLTLLTPELIKKFADATLDFVEEYVEGTKSEVDDRIVLPLCGLIRSAFNLPDDE